MDQERLTEALQKAAERHPAVAVGLELVGFPAPRQSPHGFSTLLNIIISQQISKEAAGSIRTRVEALFPSGDIAAFRALDPEALRDAGLSRPKVKYAFGLAEAVLDGRLDLESIKTQPDAEAIAMITALNGFGRWSAEIYCMFALGREDLFPGEDIALQEAMRRLEGWQDRPTAKAARQHAEKWSPHRTAMSVFLWHYYRGAPQT